VAGPAAALAAAALAACTPGPVSWDVANERRLDPPTAADGAPDRAAEALARATVATLTGADRAAAAGGTPGLSVDTAALTPPPEVVGMVRCPASLRVAAAPAAPRGAPSAASDAHAGHVMPMPAATAVPAAGATGAVAVWWGMRPDRSAALLLSRSADGGRTWGAALPVDTLDRSELGCERPAPSVTADPATGYVHVAYSMQAPEGPGVFYAHQMDPRAAFERPQVIVYGDRPAATSVASRGDRVVVAYEDPNTGGRPFVSIALSRTAGHAWAERVPVTGSAVSAERPVVALRGPRDVVLGWVERSAPRTLSATEDPRVAVAPLPSGVVVRAGRLRE
jgi:hypothetical protein